MEKAAVVQELVCSCSCTAVAGFEMLRSFDHVCIYSFSRERKREREREDLWKKLENLSLTNARKEGISLDNFNHFNSE